ncbi:MAG: selenocysteine-specific translation elongation factor [Mogibacterium sp.]|nr:selenocysteine-specific translation elongation factor [Mogibacterium sp.]
MKNIIIGTAGHVDHGKTQLIKALSGIDTDRLAEEKKRGITIELGFAHIPNDAGYNIGVIDVPGHEKFIKNMLAGIGGIDFVLFVVAADEGIMPQTKEHFEILQALGIEDGIIAVTKIDMVDEEWLEMLLEEVEDYFKGSFLEGKPVIPVSSRTGENIERLREEILRKCDRETKRQEDPRLFRLPVDRVFTMSGFGTVVTGTLIDGTCSVNQEVFLYPQGIRAKVRGIQTYGKEVEQAIAGQRTAINLSGIRKEDIGRGDLVAAEGAVTVTNMIDVALREFSDSDRVILNNSRVHFYAGSKEALCKVVLMDREELMPGDECYAQLRFEEPMALKRGDRFIVRFYSPIITIGGGRVLDVRPDKHKRSREEVLTLFETLDRGSDPEVVQAKAGSRRFYTEAELAAETGILPEELQRIVGDGVAAGMLVRLGDGTVLSRQKYDQMTGKLRQLMEEYHAENPLADGMPKQELLSRLRDLWHLEQDAVIQAIVNRLLADGTLTDKGKAVSMAGFEASFTPEQLRLKERIAAQYGRAGLEIPKNDELYALDPDKRVINAIFDSLLSEGVIVKVDPSYNISAEAWKQVVAAAKELGAAGGFTLAEFRDKLGTSRKYAAIYLPALDRAGVTVFDGEKRFLPGGRR